MADGAAGRGVAAGGLPVAAASAAAARAGLRPGDRIVWLAGAAPVDVLDLENAAADGAFAVTALRDGHPLDLVVAPRAGEWHGISLAYDGLGAPTRMCRNRCRFCFVDQVPRGLRPGLYVKDDDYRLSFLHGNFVTLTNLSERDLRRIEELRLSPLYVSLHAWDDEVRVRMMGRRAAGSRAVLERLAAAGVRTHLQVVLCPGWNDGDVLAETVASSAELDGVEDVGVVPVSLAAEGDLRRVTAGEAHDLVRTIDGWQERYGAERGAAFVHAADELYLLCGRTPPPSDAPEQYENGVGMTAAFLADVEEVVQRSKASTRASRDPGGGLRILGGTLATPVIAAAAMRLSEGLGVPVRPLAVENRLFGAHVTVTGLLGGEEVLQALRDEPPAAGEWLVAPRVFLPAALGRTLDDVGEEELAAACGGRLVLAASLTEAFATLSG